MKSRSKNLLLLILYSLLIVSCHSSKFVNARKSESGFFVNLFENKLNSSKLNILLEAKSPTNNIDFKCEEYGKFKVISPEYKRGKYNQISLSVIKTSSNVIQINKDDELILVFILGDTKEEFNVKIIDDKIQIKPLQASNHFEFQNNLINTVPENTLCIRSFKLNNLSQDIINNLRSLNCIPLKLPLGYYSHFSLENYNKIVRLAHKRKNSDHYMYFFHVEENYNKIQQLLQNKQYNDDKSENYNYYFNFNIDSKIELENSDNKFITIKLQDEHNLNSGKSENNLNSGKISFNSGSQTSAEIEIFNSDGELLISNTLNFTVGGNYEYKWNGLFESGKKAEKGIYFYKLRLGDENSVKKMIILK